MWLVGSKLIKSNVTIFQQYFFRAFFSTKDVMCRLHYDVIYHPSRISSQYLKIRRGGLTALKTWLQVINHYLRNASNSAASNPFIWTQVWTDAGEVWCGRKRRQKHGALALRTTEWAWNSTFFTMNNTSLNVVSPNNLYNFSRKKGFTIH